MTTGPAARRPLRRGTALAVLATALAACGSSTTSSSSGGGGTAGAVTTATKVASIASGVPSATASKGTLVVASDASYAPNEFIGTDGSTVVGMDVDLVTAIAQVLGLRVQVTNVKFDNILPGMGSKYDLGISSFTDTKEREATVDFVTYFSAGTSFIVRTSDGPSITKLDDLCGHHVAVERGTTELDDATGQKKKCTDAGKPDVDVQPYDDQNGANLALHSKRADVGMADSPVAAYAVKQSNGDFKVSGQPYGTAPYGIAIPKNSGMAKPVLDALKELMSDGVYAAILANWGVGAGAINNPQINGASS